MESERPNTSLTLREEDVRLRMHAKGKDVREWATELGVGVVASLVAAWRAGDSSDVRQALIAGLFGFGAFFAFAFHHRAVRRLRVENQMLHERGTNLVNELDRAERHGVRSIGAAEKYVVDNAVKFEEIANREQALRTDLETRTTSLVKRLQQAERGRESLEKSRDSALQVGSDAVSLARELAQDRSELLQLIREVEQLLRRETRPRDYEFGQRRVLGDLEEPVPVAERVAEALRVLDSYNAQLMEKHLSRKLMETFGGKPKLDDVLKTAAPDAVKILTQLADNVPER